MVGASMGVVARERFQLDYRSLHQGGGRRNEILQLPGGEFMMMSPGLSVF